MIIRLLVVIFLLTVVPHPLYGQGLFDSVFGPGGLGLWGGNSSNLSNPNYGNNPQLPQYPQQGQLPPPTQQGYGYPQQPGQPQQGVYSDWQSFPPASMEQYYEQPGQADPQVQYQTPYQQQVPQPVPQYQQPPVNPPPRQPVQARRQPAPRAQPQVPQQQPIQPTEVTAEDLPAGAVRVTTTTPDGTTVQYYPPSGAPGIDPNAAQAQPTPKRSTPKRSGLAAPQAPATGSNTGEIAMPKPEQIPQGSDPRLGWGAAVNRGPAINRQ